MKKIKNSKLAKFISITLSIIIIQGFYSCQEDTKLIDLDGNEINLKSQTLTGKEIFKGIYFLSGELPEIISSLDVESFEQYFSQLSDSEMVEYIEFQEHIVNTIETNNSTFFDDFFNKMTSGNHFQIQEALDQSKFEYQMALFSIPEFAEVAERLEDADLEYEDFLDAEGVFDSALFESTLSLLLEDVLIDGEKFGIVLAVVLILGAVVVVAIAAGAVVAIGAVAGVYLAAVAGEVVAIITQFHVGWRQLETQDLLKIEVFIDEISEKLYLQ